ncbi:MAG: hypothetical protein ACLUNS_02280 [Alistipes shahii]
MLDKSLPYKSIIMRMEAAVAERLAPPAPAAGYRIRPFAPGDERHWARIETPVGRVLRVQLAARAYFERVYLPEAALRCCSSSSRNGRTRRNGDDMDGRGGIAASATTQWVAVEPAHSGTGSGTCDRHGGGATAVRLAPGEAILLHTQTWSHRALRLYRSLDSALLPHADDRHAEQGGDGHEALPQRIRRGDGYCAARSPPPRSTNEPHGVPVIGEAIGYSSGVSM